MGMWDTIIEVNKLIANVSTWPIWEGKKDKKSVNANSNAEETRRQEEIRELEEQERIKQEEEWQKQASGPMRTKHSPATRC